MDDLSSAPASTSLTLLLLGPMQVWVHERPLPHLRSRKTLWLLALLTLRHGRPVEREWLAGTLWPDMDQSRAAANLRANLTHLRRALGDERERLQSPGRHTLSLDLTGAEVDVHTFDAALASQKPEALKQAVALYRGPLLQDCAEEWVIQERRGREQNCLQALQTLADAARVAGDYGAAIAYFQRAVHLDPWNEAPRRAWMEALAQSGDPNAALRVYREWRALLRNDPHALPDAQTSALYERLRAQIRQPPRAPSAGTPAQWAVNASAPPRASGSVPHPLTDLVGRENERREVSATLRASRLVTLTGPGGIGKTRLALEVAREILEDGTAYSEGVWFVALETLTEGRGVLAQIASVLGVQEEAGRALLQSLTQHLRPKRLLLVLDNCEHLLEASAQMVSHLLGECALVRILATSREALGIPGETLWQVPPLAAPDPEELSQGSADLLERLVGYASVQLFVERAEGCQKGFALTRSNALAVGEVCHQLEGIPLALELAAARVRALTVEQIAARLSDRLSLLSVGSRTAQSRQQTLRATLDWSYALLSEAERLLLGRLSVFAGGWTLEAAEHVCHGESSEEGQVLDLLASLVDKSLVGFAERAGDAGGRYRLLETVRQYAAERLQASGETEQVKTRHRDWFLMLAEEAALKLNGSEQEPWLNRLEAELDNLRATLALGASTEDDRATELRLVGALWQFWDIHGHYSEGRHYLQQALQRHETQESKEARAKALMGEAALSLRQGDLAASRKLHQQSLSLFRESDNRNAIASSLANQGAVASIQGDFAAALTLLEESLSLHRELDNKMGIAAVLRSLGFLVESQGGFAKAQTLFEESLSLNKQLGNPRGIALALESIGNLALLKGEYVEAQMLYEECQGLFRTLGDKYGIALSIGCLGICFNYRGDQSAAYPLFVECLGLFRELGDRQGIAQTLSNLGIVANEQGDSEQAQMLLEEGLTLLRQSGDRDGIAFVLSNLGNVVKERGDYASAWGLLEESLTICSAMGNRLGVAECLERLAAVLCLQSAAQKAVHLWGAADALRKALGAPLPLYERERYDRQLKQAHSVLGEDAFGSYWEKGRAMPWTQVIAYALSNTIVN